MVSIIVVVFGFIAAYFLIALIRALHFHFITSRRLLNGQGAVKYNIGDITIEELSKYDGTDPFKPLLVAIRGQIFDVQKSVDFYGPGKSYSVYAGREVSRALGKMSLKESDCNGDLSDLTEKELSVLSQWEDKFHTKYPLVGRVIESKVLTLEELKSYDGSDESKPMILSVRGTLFDVSSGQAFYGPGGAYPFAGRECARALAKHSVEVSDCVGDVTDCSLTEMDALRSWESLFHSKYPVIGKLKA